MKATCKVYAVEARVRDNAITREWNPIPFWDVPMDIISARRRARIYRPIHPRDEVRIIERTCVIVSEQVVT